MVFFRHSTNGYSATPTTGSVPPINITRRTHVAGLFEKISQTTDKQQGQFTLLILLKQRILIESDLTLPRLKYFKQTFRSIVISSIEEIVRQLQIVVK